MFDFLFGGKKKVELIRELLEQRMREAGFDDIESRLKIKQLSNAQLMSTPEACVVTIIETVLKMQKQGALLSQIISGIENHRSSLGHDSSQFQEILNMSRGSSSEAGAAVPMYAFYRVSLEAPGRMTEEQFETTFSQAVSILAK